MAPPPAVSSASSAVRPVADSRDSRRRSCRGCSLQRRRQRDDVAERRERRVFGLVDVRQELGDDHTALRVRDQVDFTPRVFRLHRPELVSERNCLAVELRPGVLLRVRTAIGCVRERRDLTVAVADVCRVDLQRDAVLPGAAVDAGHGHHRVPGATSALGLLRVVGAVGAGASPRQESSTHRVEVRDGRGQHGTVPEPARNPTEPLGRMTDGRAQVSGDPCHVAKGGADSIEQSATVVLGRDDHLDPSRQVQRLGQRPALHLRRAEAALVRTVGGREADELREVGRHEQRHGIDVPLPHPQTKVQDARMITAAAARSADHHAARYPLTAPDADGREERIRRPQTTGVRNHNVERAADASRERDLTRARGAHGSTARCDEIRAAMAGAVARCGCDEGPRQHAGDRAQPCAGHRTCGRGGGQRGAHDDQCDGERDGTGGRPSRRVTRPHRRLPSERERGRGKRCGGSRRSSRTIRRATRNLVQWWDAHQGRRAQSARGDARYGRRSDAGSTRRERSWRIALVWIWHTRLSVTPSTSPISASVRPS